MTKTTKRDPSRQCAKKVAYTKSEAKAKIKDMESRLRGKRRGANTGMCRYKCPHCGKWHVGHRPGSLRKIKRLEEIEAKKTNAAPSPRT